MDRKQAHYGRLRMCRVNIVKLLSVGLELLTAPDDRASLLCISMEDKT